MKLSRKKLKRKMIENLINSIIPVLSMTAGFYIGYKLRGDGGKDKLPDIKSPKQIVKERRELKEEEQELEEVKKWIEEINNYNGEFSE